MRIAWIVALVALAAAAAGHTDYGNWAVMIGIYNDHPFGYSDYFSWFGVKPGATDRYGGEDAWHLPIEDPEHDTAWIYVADRGGNGGWNEQTGQYEEYPYPGLRADFFAPFGPDTADPDTLMKVWTVEVHAPNVGYTWRLRWQINQEGPEWWIPDPPFAIRIRPNETFPEGLDLTANGAGYFWVTDLPQWGPEPQIWLIEAGIIPEPGLAWLAAAIPLVAIALRRRFGVRQLATALSCADEPDPEHPQDPPQPWLKYCKATNGGLVWKKIRNVRA
jgi:hypothetical protein